MRVRAIPDCFWVEFSLRGTISLGLHFCYLITIHLLKWSVMCLGLGSIYGDHELCDNMDRHSELKIVDKTLWKHFEQFVWVIGWISLHLVFWLHRMHEIQTILLPMFVVRLSVTRLNCVWFIRAAFAKLLWRPLVDFLVRTANSAVCHIVNSFLYLPTQMYCCLSSLWHIQTGPTLTQAS